MNIPENFNKIDGIKFKIGVHEFTIEVDHMEKGDCWVIHDGMYDDGGKHPLCFDIDWENETYRLIKCKPGDGRNGSSITTNAVLVKYLMKDADSFVNSFLKDIVTTLIHNRLI